MKASRLIQAIVLLVIFALGALFFMNRNTDATPDQSAPADLSP